MKRESNEKVEQENYGRKLRLTVKNEEKLEGEYESGMKSKVGKYKKTRVRKLIEKLG